MVTKVTRMFDLENFMQQAHRLHALEACTDRGRAAAGSSPSPHPSGTPDARDAMGEEPSTSAPDSEAKRQRGASLVQAVSLCCEVAPSMGSARAHAEKSFRRDCDVFKVYVGRESA